MRFMPSVSMKRGLADPGHAADPDPLRATGVRQQRRQQLLRLLPVIGPPRLDQRDRPGDRSPVAAADALDRRTRVPTVTGLACAPGSADHSPPDWRAGQHQVIFRSRSWAASR